LTVALVIAATELRRRLRDRSALLLVLAVSLFLLRRKEREPEETD